VFFQDAAHGWQGSADLAPVIPGSSAERKRGGESFADFLKQLSQSASAHAGRADVWADRPECGGEPSGCPSS
jgi:hypothetical protein